ncbi:hypothetical protein EXIGLDRAFT_832361 [Exidia glandulosa HHB12029]|uniref:Transmembrane protein n=1 Tax=Exidia glandulosa HHB12029 TaxID=1314781 RepID=A0A165LN63_EXIGL|nr:hypothetical protein EXIGLDRAFT_832361 [Exidia glandulosa HHB12029]
MEHPPGADHELGNLGESEENPAPPREPPTRAVQQIAVRGTARVKSTLPYWCGLLIFIAVWLFVHGILFMFVYFYARAEAYPLPRGIINHTYRGLTAFSVIGAIIGGLLGFFNAILLMACLSPLSPSYKRGCCIKGAAYVIRAIVFLSVLLFFCMSGFISSSVWKAHTYAHACEDDWMMVVLTGHDYSRPGRPNTATFFLSSAPSEALFIFTSQDPDPNTFGLVDLESTAAVRPALQNITYDYTARTFLALCHGKDGSSTCASGTFDDRSFLTFDISYNGTRSVSRSVYRDWTLEDTLSIILYRVDTSTNTLVDRMLQTSVDNLAVEVKVCVPHQTDASADILNADILVPFGWMIYQHGVFSVKSQ